MAYLIYKSDGTAVTIPDNAIDTAYYDASGGGGFGPGNIPQAGHGLGVQLVGRNTIGYGAAVAQSFLQLQENFCSSAVPADAFSLQGQLWFNQSSVTDGNLFVRTRSDLVGINNWKELLLSDSSGNLVVSGTVTATEFIGPATSVFGGAARQILVQTAPSVTGFITAPVSAGTFLAWNGSNFAWSTAGGSGTVTSVGVSSNGTYAGALTVGASPVTSAGTITITPNVFTAGAPGVVPGSGGGTGNFLRADGTWASPPSGSGTVTSVSVSSANAAVTVSGSPVTSSGTITITPNNFAAGTPGVVPASGGGTSNFLRADGVWTTPPSSGGTVTSVAVSGGSTGLTTSGGPVTGAGTITLAGTLNVASGGTGAGTQTANGVLLGNGTSPISATAVGTAGQLLVGSGAAPAWSSVALVSGSGLAVTGAITATGNITAFFSDRRLKENVTPLADAVAKIETLNGIRYTPNALAASFGYDRNEAIVGLFADEVQAVLPEAVKRAPFDTENGVSKSGENYITVQYEKLVPLLVEAIKELTARIRVLEGK